MIVNSCYLLFICYFNPIKLSRNLFTRIARFSIFIIITIIIIFYDKCTRVKNGNITIALLINLSVLYRSLWKIIYFYLIRNGVRFQFTTLIPFEKTLHVFPFKVSDNKLFILNNKETPPPVNIVRDCGAIMQIFKRLILEGKKLK